MHVFSLSSFRPEIKPARLSARQRHLADMAWRSCKPSLDRIARRSPHHADRIATLLAKRIKRAIRSNEDRLTIPELARIEFIRALIHGVQQADLAQVEPDQARCA